MDSLADHIVNFSTEKSKLTQKFLPQLGLKTSRKTMNGWQSKYLLENVSESFKGLLERMNSSVNQHDLRKSYGLEEDAWENYLYHDSKHAVSLICHQEPLSISEQIIVTKFIEESI